MDIIKQLKNPDKKYRPIPFWSWNERLSTEETARQIDLMDKAGIGGFFMHARGGLQTEYMGKEWFENISVGTDEAKKRGMGAFAYDENGWPSGFGCNKVNSLGIEYQQKFLRYEKGEGHAENTIANIDGFHFYYEVNPYYVDNLDKRVVKKFIDVIYGEYYKKYKNEISGFFTDEPQLSRNGIPWSFVLEEEYKKEYGDTLFDKLNELYFDKGNYGDTRFKFWKLVTRLFSEAYCKQIYEWCDERGLIFTGHMVCEETIESQLTTNGSVMANYEYFHIPGIDWLGRCQQEKTIPLQMSSVAHQTGKKQTISETFALTGWNASFEDLRWLFEYQMVRGVTLLCPHLQGYSLRGIRKRDYPPSVYYQQPWWSEYPDFVSAMSRIGMLLSEGRVNYDTLLIHPMSSGWVKHNYKGEESVKDIQDELFNAIDCLEKKHILFDLGDETVMERHARVENGEIIIGTQHYKTVVLTGHEVLFENTIQLLEKFKAEGGRVAACDKIEPSDIIDNENITFTAREFDGYNVYYFVNSSESEQKAKISRGSKSLDILTGELTDFDRSYTFLPRTSLVVFDYFEEYVQPEKKEPTEQLDLSGKWQICEPVENSLTLDRCTYYIDGKLMGKAAWVSEIQEVACSYEKSIHLKMVFDFYADYIPKNMHLVCEQPELLDIMVNDKKINKMDCGFYKDISFRKLDISDCIRIGHNQIVAEVEFSQSKETYEDLANIKYCETILNKLSFSTEIENMYLIGDFSVRCDGSFARLDKKAVRYSGGFVIDKPKTEAELDGLEQQGFVFFADALTLKKEYNLENTNLKIVLAEKNANAVIVKVNGQNAGKIIWNPLELDISQYLRKGKNIIELTLVHSLRNLLGPHHLESGECYLVSPGCFFPDSKIWGRWHKDVWNEKYCFAEFGIKHS